ncbi:MAG: hypothetical protein KC912_03995 [Proteobacteria bacterium]|nr:hypothetical protein [Pseudomonadota bacterium]
MIRPLLLLTVLALAFPAAAGELPALSAEDPAAAWSEARQSWLPALTARTTSAEERSAAREAYFIGDATLAEGFPHLAQNAIDDPLVIGGQLQALDTALKARLAERAEPLPDLGSSKRTVQLTQARTAALDAEDHADSLERRLLLARQGFFETHSVWASGARALTGPVQSAIDALRNAETDDDPTATARAAAEATALDSELAKIRTWSSVLADHAAAPSTELPELDPQAADSGTTAAFALQRLKAISNARPEHRSVVDDLEQRWIVEQALPALSADLPPAPTDDVAQALADAESAVAAAEEALQAHPEAEPDTLASARRQLAAADLDRAARWRDHLLEAKPSTSSSEAERAREEAERARHDAEAARASASDQRAIAVADARSGAAKAQERAAQAWETTRTHDEALTAVRLKRSADSVRLTQAVATIKRPVLGEPAPSADATYAELRSLVGQLRADAAEQTQKHKEIESEMARLAELHEAERARIQEGTTIAPPAMDRWASAIEDEARAAKASLEANDLARDATIGLLHDVKEVRRELRGYVSSAQTRQDRADLIANIGHELSLTGPNLLAMSRERLAALISLPRRLMDLSFLGAMMRGSFLTLLFSAFWWMGRVRTELVVKQVLRQIRKRFPTVRPAELRGLRAPLDNFLRYSIDLIAGWMLREPLGALAPELGFLVLVWLQVALFRCIVAAFDVLIVRHPERRPAWLVLNEQTHGLARRTLRFVLLWWILRRFAQGIALNVLGADALAEGLGIAFFLGGLALVLWVLQSWHAPLFTRMQRLHQGSAAVRLLSTPVKSRLLHAPHTLGMAAYLATALAWDLLDRLARQTDGIGRIFNAISRYRLGQDEQTEEIAALPPEAIERVRTAEAGKVRRTKAEEALTTAIESWRRERRRGLIALVGDRGEGKGVLIQQLLPRLGFEGRPAVEICLTERIRTEEDALRWLATALNLTSTPSSPDDCVAQVLELEPTVWVTEDLHLAFLRTVGGLEGLNALLYIFNATSSQHLWLVTLHSPAWHYLTRLGGLVDTGIFRQVVSLKPLGEEELRELTLRRLSIAGFTADFSPLLRSNPFGADPEVELERTTSVFYRLLAEASAGNPNVALHLFTECLCADPDRPKVALIRVRRALAANVDHLPDPELFALTAIRTQAALSLPELIEVTNMGKGSLRQIVKNLESQQLLHRKGDQISIPGLELPSVTRTLRRRHFLHGAA